MAVLQISSVPDLIEATLEVLDKFKLTDLSFATQHYHAYNRILLDSRIDKQSGTRCRVNILKDSNTTTRWKGIYQTDGNADQVDGLTHGSVPWRLFDFYWTYDENEEDVNTGEAQIQDYVKIKRHQAYMGNAEFIENWFWDSPPTTGDTTMAFNLRYWLTKNVTAAGTSGDTTAGAGSFSGSYPTGSDGVAHTTIAGLTLAGNLLRYKNYTFKWTDASANDLLPKWRTAMRVINFTPPTGLEHAKQAGPPRFEHFVNGTTWEALTALAEGRNDDLGYDLAGRPTTFARGNITWAPKLDADTDEPIYSVDWGTLALAILKQKWMKERKAMLSPFQHEVWVNWIDSRGQFICYDRRRNSVGSKAAANP